MSLKQKTILHLIDTTGPGGAETVFTQLAAETQNRGWRSIALIRGKGWVASELNRLGVETVIQDCKGSINFVFLKFLINLIKSQKVDVIQSHLLGSNLYASMAGLVTGKPVIATFHGFVDVNIKEKFRLIKFLAIRLGAKSVIAVTNQIRDMLVNTTTLSSKKIKVIANGVDTEFFSPKQHYEVDPTGLIRVGCLGNVRTAKNYPLAIHALKKLKDKGMPIELLIAGDDTNSLAVNCKNLAEELGVSPNIVWKGFITDSAEYLRSLDIFLLCSSSEGHPLALTQAMSVGLPIVTTACGVEHVITPNKSALVSENENVDAVVNSICQFIENQSIRESFGITASSEAREHWSFNNMLSEYLALYEFRVN